MYGIVNSAIQDLVIQKFGKDAWLKIKEIAKITEDAFYPLKPYPDDTTYQLVFAISSATGLEVEKVLHTFGKYWVTYTESSGYGSLMDMFGSNFMESLSNLNQLHERMGLTMPELKAPKFYWQSKDNKGGVLEYQSHRKHLVPMVHGLLEGLAEKFKENVVIEYLPPQKDQEQKGNEFFSIRMVG